MTLPYLVKKKLTEQDQTPQTRQSAKLLTFLAAHKIFNYLETSSEDVHIHTFN